MSEYNQRQYGQMLERIASLQAETIGLPKGINDLKALIACLESPDENQKKTLQKKWGVLEEVYAVSQDQGLKKIPSHHQALIQKALEEMKTILEQAAKTESSTH